jgi:hypothetical protein
MVSVTLNKGFSNPDKIIVIDEETMRLFRDRKALKALLEGQVRRKNGSNKGKLVEEIFHDLI